MLSSQPNQTKDLWKFWKVAMSYKQCLQLDLSSDSLILISALFPSFCVCVPFFFLMILFFLAQIQGIKIYDGF